MSLKFRPHHFLCTLCFQGKGYSPHFVKNYLEITEQLRQNPQTPITVVGRTDSICTACPHKLGAKCQSEAKVQGLDQAHAAALGISPDDVITWQEAQARIAQQIDLKTFHQICATCGWKELGICEQVLTEHRSKI